MGILNEILRRFRKKKVNKNKYVKIKSIHFYVDEGRYLKLVNAKKKSGHDNWTEFFCNKYLGDGK